MWNFGLFPEILGGRGGRTENYPIQRGKKDFGEWLNNRAHKAEAA